MGFYENNKTDFGAEPRLFESALHSLEAGRFAEALLYLSNLTEKDPLRGGPSEGGPEMPAVYFNLALCYLKAGDYQAAVGALEKSLGRIKKLPRSGGGAPDSAGSGHVSRTEAYKTLRTLEVRTESYLSPMNADFPARFTALAEQNVLMALIYGYKKCGLPDKAKALAAGLTGAEFAALREG